MPEPWDQQRVTIVLQALAVLIDAAELDDAAVDAVLDAVLPRLQERAGRDALDVHAAAASVLAQLSARRH